MNNSFNRTMRSFFLESGAEILKSFRAPEFILPTLLMPVAFYTLFATIVPMGPESAPYLLATYGVFAVMGPAIFGFGISVANERDKGWLALKRVSPATGGSYIAAKVLSTLIFASFSVASIYLVAGFAADVSFTRATWASLLMIHLFSVFPFILIGLSIGFLCNANAAVAVSNILFLSFSALGGLWIPIMVFPPAMQSFAHFLPTYHLSEIALAVSQTSGQGDISYHLLVIGVMTALLALFTALAWSKQRNS